MVDHELINLRQDEKIDLDKLKQYLTTLLKIDIDKINILQFSGGHANLTYLISFDHQEFVLLEDRYSVLLLLLLTTWQENTWFNILE